MIAYVIAVPAPICILLSTIYCVQCRKSYLEIRHSLSFRVFCPFFSFGQCVVCVRLAASCCPFGVYWLFFHQHVVKHYYKLYGYRGTLSFIQYFASYWDVDDFPISCIIIYSYSLSAIRYLSRFWLSCLSPLADVLTNLYL
jgi:hypothetical protein